MNSWRLPKLALTFTSPMSSTSVNSIIAAGGRTSLERLDSLSETVVLAELKEFNAYPNKIALNNKNTTSTQLRGNREYETMDGWMEQRRQQNVGNDDDNENNQTVDR